MEIVVVGRHAEVTDRFRTHVEDKLTKITQLAPRAQRVEVELTHERNPRLSDVSERIELTVVGKGPVVRAEAQSDDQYASFELAYTKLMERLRRARDRHKDRRRGAGSPVMPSTLPEPAPPGDELAAEAATEVRPTPELDGDAVESSWGDSPVVIREKLHRAEPMTLDDALYEMEMVGHDFYLFVDAETGQPAVAYRRRGWSYGVIRLDAPVRTEAAV